MHDPGEGDDDGSLIIGRYGKGTFVYTGLVFFRELPAGVPGARSVLVLRPARRFRRRGRRRHSRGILRAGGVPAPGSLPCDA